MSLPSTVIEMEKVCEVVNRGAEGLESEDDYLVTYCALLRSEQEKLRTPGFWYLPRFAKEQEKEDVVNVEDKERILEAIQEPIIPPEFGYLVRCPEDKVSSRIGLHSLYYPVTTNAACAKLKRGILYDDNGQPFRLFQIKQSLQSNFSRPTQIGLDPFALNEVAILLYIRERLELQPSKRISYTPLYGQFVTPENQLSRIFLDYPHTLASWTQSDYHNFTKFRQRTEQNSLYVISKLLEILFELQDFELLHRAITPWNLKLVFVQDVPSNEIANVFLGGWELATLTSLTLDPLPQIDNLIYTGHLSDEDLKGVDRLHVAICIYYTVIKRYPSFVTEWPSNQNIEKEQIEQRLEALQNTKPDSLWEDFPRHTPFQQTVSTLLNELTNGTELSTLHKTFHDNVSKLSFRQVPETAIPAPVISPPLISSFIEQTTRHLKHKPRQRTRVYEEPLSPPLLSKRDCAEALALFRHSSASSSSIPHINVLHFLQQLAGSWKLRSRDLGRVACLAQGLYARGQMKRAISTTPVIGDIDEITLSYIAAMFMSLKLNGFLYQNSRFRTFWETTFEFLHNEEKTQPIIQQLVFAREKELLLDLNYSPVSDLTRKIFLGKVCTLPLTAFTEEQEEKEKKRVDEILDAVITQWAKEKRVVLLEAGFLYESLQYNGRYQGPLKLKGKRYKGSIGISLSDISTFSSDESKTLRDESFMLQFLNKCFEKKISLYLIDETSDNLFYVGQNLLPAEQTSWENVDANLTLKTRETVLEEKKERGLVKEQPTGKLNIPTRVAQAVNQSLAFIGFLISPTTVPINLSEPPQELERQVKIRFPNDTETPLTGHFLHELMVKLIEPQWFPFSAPGFTIVSTHLQSFFVMLVNNQDHPEDVVAWFLFTHGFEKCCLYVDPLIVKQISERQSPLVQNFVLYPKEADKGKACAIDTPLITVLEITDSGVFAPWCPNVGDKARDPKFQREIISLIAERLETAKKKSEDKDVGPTYQSTQDTFSELSYIEEVVLGNPKLLVSRFGSKQEKKEEEQKETEIIATFLKEYSPTYLLYPWLYSLDMIYKKEVLDETKSFKSFKPIIFLRPTTKDLTAFSFVKEAQLHVQKPQDFDVFLLQQIQLQQVLSPSGQSEIYKKVQQDCNLPSTRES